jgi:Bacterial extracellular solute-binding proteins, family 3
VTTFMPEAEFNVTNTKAFRWLMPQLLTKRSKWSATFRSVSWLINGELAADEEGVDLSAEDFVYKLWLLAMTLLLIEHLMKLKTVGAMHVRRSAIAALLLALASAGGTAEPLRTLVPGTLRIGTYFVTPPFEYVAKGLHVGFEVDLMQEIARRLGLKAVFVDTHWEKILQEMEEGRYDCIVGWHHHHA